MYHKWQWYDVWFLKYRVQQTEFFVILGYFFLPLYLPLKQHEKSKCWNNEKDWRYLHLSTINENHMMYDSWDMEHDRKNLAHFRPVLITQRIKILKRWMKHLVISSFYTSVPKIMIICYTAPEIWHMTDAIMFHFGQCFALLQPRKWKLQKKKKWLEISSFNTNCTKNHDHILYCSWDMACDRCNCYFSFWAHFCPFTP